MLDKYQFEFSVIMPIYNTEDYLNEAIDSVINQTIGFKENIQLILIDDGSVDGSGEICLEYQKKYPQNIIYEKKENGGVASACNTGLNHVQGKYVNFFGSDDIWDENAFKLVFLFFEEHYSLIDIVACRFKDFGTREGFNHPLDYKYTNDRIVDLLVDYKDVVLSSGNCFIKSEAIEGRTFNVELNTHEDACFINELILNRCKYGIMKSAIYNYRRRNDSSSLINNAGKNKSWYFNVPRQYFLHLMELSQQLYGEILPYIQYIVMYGIQWHVRMQKITFLSEQECDQYVNLIVSILKRIEDRIIYMQKNINVAQKLYVFNLKYGKNIVKDAEVTKKGFIRFNGTKIFNMKAKPRCLIQVIEIEGESVLMKGTTDLTLLGDEFVLYARDKKNELYPLQLCDAPKQKILGFKGENVLTSAKFTVKVPVRDHQSIRLVIKKGNQIIDLKPSYTMLSKLDDDLVHSYFTSKNYLVKLENNNIKFYQYNKKTHFVSELRYLKELCGRKQIRAICYRITYYIAKLFCNKPIWLVSDRDYKAGDNGEYFFRYVMKSEQRKDYNVFFVFNKNAKGYNILQKVGNIIHPNSIKYRLVFLLSNKIISSHADRIITDPFGRGGKYYRDLYKYDYIFLTHGITQGDLSSWLGDLYKNFKLFIAASEKERQEILKGNYGYTEKEVKVTGLARYDGLKSDVKVMKKIMFAPTWRANLAGAIIPASRERQYSQTFKDSQYFNFYNSLINDERLLEEMEKHGYFGEFFVHPSLKEQSKDFSGNNIIKIRDSETDYESEFKKSALLITDYSSIAFDFAYLKKPIIYCQYDKESFYANHFYHDSYFSYETEGFGPVCSTEKAVVNTIVSYISNDCKVENIYVSRRNTFYMHQDEHNCERILNEILKI